MNRSAVRRGFVAAAVVLAFTALGIGWMVALGWPGSPALGYAVGDDVPDASRTTDLVRGVRILPGGGAAINPTTLIVVHSPAGTVHSVAFVNIAIGIHAAAFGPAPPVPAPPPSSAATSPGMPAAIDQHNIYAAAGREMLSAAAAAAAAAAKALVYVPHSKSGDIWVIDPASFRVIATYPAGTELQHVVPSYDLRTLYASDDRGNSLLPFDPATGKPGAKIPVLDPYNLYYTPDGAFAISVAERLRTLVWYDPKTWQQRSRTPVPGCAGINHADFTADGRMAVFTCEFAGRVAVVDVVSHQLLRLIDMPQRNAQMGPQDIRLSPDGAVFYIADSDAGGLWVLDGAASHVLRFIRTGRGAHSLIFDRDAKRLFVTNRLQGSISVLDAYTGAFAANWPIQGGGSPDMGNVTADGTQLWVSGRYDRAVYVLSTKDGSLVRKIHVGNEPHGLDVWPQPGRYSLGHTGITR